MILRNILAGRSGKKILALLLPVVFAVAPFFLAGNPALLAILRAVQPWVLPSDEPAPADPGGQPADEADGETRIKFPGGYIILPKQEELINVD